MAKKLLTGADFSGQRAQNLADATGPSDAVTLAQLQAYVRGLDWKPSVRAASTANLTIATPGSTIDGVTLSSGDRVLLKDQSTGAQNGIYVWSGASSPLVRANDADSDAEVTAGLAVFVSEGTSNGDKAFVLTTNDPITLGTTALVFTQFGGGVTYTADGQGIELGGTTFSLELDGTTLSKSAAGLRVGSGAAGAGLVEASGVLAVGAGTGISVTADAVAVDTSVVTRKFSANCAATTNPQTFTHNLGTLDIHAQVVIVATGEHVEADITSASTNTVTVDFGGAPTASQYRVVVFG